jgi:hypothetical protein
MQGYHLTGPEAATFQQVAGLLTAQLAGPSPISRPLSSATADTSGSRVS